MNNKLDELTKGLAQLPGMQQVTDNLKTGNSLSRRMRTPVATLLLLCVALLGSSITGVCASLAGAGGSFTLNFDENGNGSFSTNGVNFGPSPGTLLPDPTQTGSPSVLTYFLPGLVNNGDFRIWDNANQTTLSDVVRFTDANGDLTGHTADRMIFYSVADGDPALADAAGLPSALLPNDAGGVVESSSGNFQMILALSPTTGIFTTYNGVSQVPEPSAWSLLVAGGIALWAFRKIGSPAKPIWNARLNK
jgi:hypothetical protein